MDKILNKFLNPVIQVVRINKMIDNRMVQSVEAQLQKIKRTKALAVLIDSDGGLITSAEHILFKLKQFAHEKHIPLYTFAEDTAVSAAYYILSGGDRVFVDNTSQVGSVGIFYSSVSMREVLQKQNLELRDFHSNENLFSIVAGLTGQYDNKNMISQIDHQLHLKHELFIEFIKSQRPQILQQPQKIQDLIFNANIFSGTDAVKYGLADGIGTFETILGQLYPEAKLKFQV